MIKQCLAIKGLNEAMVSAHDQAILSFSGNCCLATFVLKINNWSDVV